MGCATGPLIHCATSQRKKKVNTVLQGLEEEITRAGGGGRLGGEDVALDPHLDQRSQVGEKKNNAFFDISKKKETSPGEVSTRTALL